MNIIEFWRRAHRRSGWRRPLLKIAIFALTVALVLYPKPWLVPTWLARLQDMNAVLDPTHPALSELEAEVRGQVAPDAPLPDIIGPLESTVYRHVPYAFDWETWGVVDYLPTVDEVFALGREDCDGQAVVAASLLRRMGHDARLVSDLQHTWVSIPVAGHDPIDLMSPGRGEKTLAADERGTHLRLSAALVHNVLRGATFGVTVFPLGREIVVLLVLCILALQPRSKLWRRVAGCLLLALALTLWRTLAVSPTDFALRLLWAWTGLAAAVAGWLLLVIRGSTSGAAPEA